MAKIWILTDDRAGNNTQVSGIAAALGMPCEVKKLSYTGFIRLPNILRGASLLGVDAASAATLDAPYPDLVISAGRRQAPVAKYIKQQSGGKTKLLHLMHPDCSLKEFDWVVLPEHDALKNTPENVLYTLGSPNRITQEALKRSAEAWQGKWEHLPSPRIGVLIGGKSKHGMFTLQDTNTLVRTLNTLLKGKSLLMTTSRRTSEYMHKKLDYIQNPQYFYHYAPDTDNPYFGILGGADALIVTGDSVAMCTEACATGKPVYVFIPSNTPKKHHVFLQSLFDKGYALPLEKALEPYEYTPLNEAKRIATIIKQQL